MTMRHTSTTEPTATARCALVPKGNAQFCGGLIMLTQAALTLRMHNTAFEDEALYLYVGHLEISHWLHGTALQGNYPSYFSGSPVLYPVLGALFDSIGGLTAARALSLTEMLAATGLLYTMSRRLFNERVALCAAITFAVAEPTLFLGNLATYDATALCLLAIAAWLVVRTAAFRWPAYLLAAPVAVLAVAAKYASLLFVPSIVVLAGRPGLPDRHQVHDAEPVPGQQFRRLAALGLRAVDRRAVRAGRHRRGGVRLAAVH
jgi:hypothetical protein